MSATVAQPRLRIAFAGAFAVRLEKRVRALLGMPCDVIRADEAEVVAQLPEVRAQCIAENIHRAARGEPPVHLIPAAVR